MTGGLLLATFSSTIAGWQSFYVTAGTTSATLVGLLFVAVSLHVDVLGDSSAAVILAKARRTFGRFLTVVVISLLFLIPDLSPHGLGIPLLILGVLGVLSTLRLVMLAWNERKQGHAFFGMADKSLLSLGSPVISSTLMTIVAATILAGNTSYLGYMVGVIAVILTYSANDSWSLMLDLARAKHDLATSKPIPGMQPTG